MSRAYVFSAVEHYQGSPSFDAVIVRSERVTLRATDFVSFCSALAYVVAIGSIRIRSLSVGPTSEKLSSQIWNIECIRVVGAPCCSDHTKQIWQPVRSSYARNALTLTSYPSLLPQSVDCSWFTIVKREHRNLSSNCHNHLLYEN